MWLTLIVCIPTALGQAIFSLGVTAGDAGANQGYQPLLPQSSYIQPFSAGVIPVAAYPSYPVGVGYPSSYGMGGIGGMGGMGPGMPMNYGTYPQQTGYPVYEIYRPEGPMKRFWKGAADGVIQGSLGWLG